MTDDDNKPDERSPLEQLARQAGALEAPTDVEFRDVPGAQPEVPTPTNAQLIGGAIAAGREVFCVFTKFESPRRTLGDEQAAQLGAVWGPVLDKHGIDLGRFMGDYALEVGAALATWAIVAEVRKGVVAEMAQRDQEKAAEPAPADAG